MWAAAANRSRRRFVEWATQHLHAYPGHEGWFVQWTCSAVVASEQRIPRVPSASDTSSTVWRDKTIELLEFDTALTRLCSLWRAVLDFTDEPAVVAEIVASLDHLLLRDGADGPAQWHALLLKKLQPHFVDIADVLVGWAMNDASPRSSLRCVDSLCCCGDGSVGTDCGCCECNRDAIVALLDAMQQLWVDNSVFSAQLLASFATVRAAAAARRELIVRH